MKGTTWCKILPILFIILFVIIFGKSIIDSVEYNMSQCYCCSGPNSTAVCSDTSWNGTKCLLGPAGIKTVEDSQYKKECDKYFLSDLGTFT